MSRNHLISALRHSLYRNHDFSETCAGCAHAEDVLVGADHQPRESWLDLPWSMKHCGLSDVWLVTASGKEVAQVVFNHPDVDPEEVAQFISECVGGTGEGSTEGRAAIQTAGDWGTATPPCEPGRSSVLDTPRIAGLKPGPSPVAPTDGSQPADVLSPTSGTASVSDGAAPACSFCGQLATCYGHYEGVEEAEDGTPDQACDDCCHHYGDQASCQPILRHQADGHAEHQEPFAGSDDYWTLARDLMRRDK